MQGRPTSARCSTRLAALLIAAAATCPAIAAPAADEAQAEGATLPATLGNIASDLDLVEAQIEAREYEPARTWLEAHVRELEGGAHRYDPALIRPLVLLGDANMGKSEYAEALRHYQRATHLARVSAGLKSLEQIEIVYREAAAYKAIGAYQEASDREEYAYQILSARTGPNDPALLPAVYRLADWYMMTGNPFAARELYQRAIRIHDASGELDTEAAVPALQGLATTYRLERFPPTYTSREVLPASMLATPELQQPVSLNNFPVGEEALQRVARIRQQAAAEAPMAHVEAVLDLADWYTLFDKPARANALYAHAFELLGQIPDTDRNGYFATPRLLYFQEPGTPRSGRQDLRPRP
jgi:tetratricopeptide (TPR) repeat protein